MISPLFPYIPVRRISIPTSKLFQEGMQLLQTSLQQQAKCHQSDTRVKTAKGVGPKKEHCSFKKYTLYPESLKDSVTFPQ